MAFSQPGEKLQAAKIENILNRHISIVTYIEMTLI